MALHEEAGPSSARNGTAATANGTSTPKSFPIQITGRPNQRRLVFPVVSAKLNGNGGLLGKRDVYVEIVVDNSEQQTKKSAVKKRTNSPQWDEVFNVTVTDSSVIEFKVLCKNKVFDDNLFGSKTAKISHWLKRESNNGKCKCFGCLQIVTFCVFPSIAAPRKLFVFS